MDLEFFDDTERLRIERLLMELPGHEVDVGDQSPRAYSKIAIAASLHNNYLLAAILLELRSLSMGIAGLHKALELSPEELAMVSDKLSPTDKQRIRDGIVAGMFPGKFWEQQPGATGHGGTPHDE